MSDWIRCNNRMPAPGVVVDTKIDNAQGVRNEQPLKLHKGGRLWFFPDDSMYVYYEPTHWREKS